MPSVGPGVAEIRVHSEGEYRVLYVATFAEAVYVLHAFREAYPGDSSTGSRARPQAPG